VRRAVQILIVLLLNIVGRVIARFSRVSR